MLQCNAIFTLFAHYMPTWLHSLYSFVQSKYKIQRYVLYIANQPKIQRYEFLLILPSPTLKKRAFGNILLEAPSCGLREDKIFFFLTEFMPFKLEYNLHFDNIFVKNLHLVFQPI